MEVAWINRCISESKGATAVPEKVVGTNYQTPATPPRTPPANSPEQKRNPAHGFNIHGSIPVDFSRPVETSVVKGKTAIVLDGATGLGFGIATALAESGAYVAMCDPSEEAGHKAEEEFGSKGYRVKFFKTELSVWESLVEAFKQVLTWSDNSLDIVVTTPGIITTNLMLSILPKHRGPGEDPVKPPTKVIETNLLGVYFSASLALFYFNRLWAQNEDHEFRPQLVFIGSMASFDGLDFGTDYAAAKHGVRAIWKTTRRPRPSMAPYQSNLIAPGYARQDTKAPRSEAWLRKHHEKVNEISDVVAGVMRCICDETIEGRAVACPQGSIGDIPGLLNFDFMDNIAHHNGGRRLLEKVDDIWLPSSANLSEDHNCKVQ